jgi:predicted nucleic acid-binding protein
MLLDTSGLRCCHHAGEPQNAEAVRQFNSASRRLTHGYVLAEFVALCGARGLNRLAALDFVADLVDSPDVEVIWVDEILHRAAVQLQRARLDKTYSLCDAVSFVLMRQFKIATALTTDHHFEQEGFARLLRP